MNKKTIVAALLMMATVVACEKDNTEQQEQEQKDPEPAEVPADPTTDSYNKFGVAKVYITTKDGVAVDSKDKYVQCDVSVDGCDVFADYTGSGKIRGRGNSTWEWYPKKPYRLKLSESSKFLGMDKNKDWVFLANYRDCTHLMNTVGFAMAHCLDIPYTNHARYARLYINEQDMGLYLVTEQVEEGGNRVNLDASEGLLIGLDVNDGPDDCPDATDNFWSEVYETACCVKYPDDPSSGQLKAAKEAFAELEQTIESLDWKEIKATMNVHSWVAYIMIQELMCNVEMNNGNSIRSGYVNRYDSSSKWNAGPLWDCDGGFCYNWGDMYDVWGWGHTYFESYKHLVFGSEPYDQKGAYGHYPRFISDLFGVPEFVALFKETWNAKKDAMLAYVLADIDAQEEAIAEDAKTDLALWNIVNYSHKTEVKNLKNWLNKRFSYLDRIFNDYPDEI